MEETRHCRRLEANAEVDNLKDSLAVRNVGPDRSYNPGFKPLRDPFLRIRGGEARAT